MTAPRHRTDWNTSYNCLWSSGQASQPGGNCCPRSGSRRAGYPTGPVQSSATRWSRQQEATRRTDAFRRSTSARVRRPIWPWKAVIRHRLPADGHPHARPAGANSRIQEHIKMPVRKTGANSRSVAKTAPDGGAAEGRIAGAGDPAVPAVDQQALLREYFGLGDADQIVRVAARMGLPATGSTVETAAELREQARAWPVAGSAWCG